MDDAVFQNRLERQLGQAAAVQLRTVLLRTADIQLQSLREAILLDVVIRLAVLQFLLHGHQVLHLTDRIAEKFGQRFRHVRDAGQAGQQCLAANALQRVVEEVRVDLVLQRQILRLALVELKDLGRIQPELHLAKQQLVAAVEGKHGALRLPDAVAAQHLLDGASAQAIRPHDGVPCGEGQRHIRSQRQQHQRKRLPAGEQIRRAIDEEHRAARGKGQRQQTDPADQVASLFVQSHCLLRTPLLSRTACGTDRGSGPSPCGRSG